MAWLEKDETQTRPSPPLEDLWIPCERCGAQIYHETYAKNLRVCHHCGHHGKLTAQERIDILLDPGSFSETFSTLSPLDPLEFKAGKGAYGPKVTWTKKHTGLHESVVTGSGKIEGIDVIVAVMDFRFLGGSLGSGTGEKILRGAMHAYEERKPYIVISSSGGARMQEGALSLMQLAKTCAGIAKLNTRKIPYISILTNPTTGGVSASYAMVGDVHIAEPGALIGFAGRRVIEQTIRQKLPDDFQTAEYLLAHGFIDMIVERKDLRSRLALLLGYTTHRGAQNGT